MSYVVPVKSKVEISQNFVAFSEYINVIRGAEAKKPYLIELISYLRKLYWVFCSLLVFKVGRAIKKT